MINNRREKERNMRHENYLKKPRLKFEWKLFKKNQD